MKNGFHFPIFFVVALLTGACANDTARREASGPRPDLIREAYEFQLKGEAFEQKAVSDSAYTNFLRARNLYEQGHDSLRISYVLLKMAGIMRQYNDYSEMQQLDVEALQWLGKNPQPAHLLSIYTDIGISYLHLSDYAKAAQQYRKALPYAKDAQSKIALQNNLAYAYIGQENFAKALGILQRLSPSCLENQSTTVRATVMDNLGYCHFRLGQKGAEALLQQALKMRQQAADKSGLVSSYLHLAEFHQRSNASQSIAYATAAHNTAKGMNAADDRLMALEFLLKNTQGQYAKDYVRLSDSLRTSRQKARNHFAALKYDFRKEREAKLKAQAEKAEAHLEEAAQRNQKTIWLIVAVALSVLSILLFGFLYFWYKNKKWRANYDAETRISRRLHDELANEMHQTMVFTETTDLNQKTNLEKLLQRLDESYRRVRNISREHAAVATKIEFRDAIRNLVTSYRSANCKILLTGIDSIDWEILAEEKQVAIHRGVQELLVNMHKHSGCTLAVIKFGKVSNALLINYSDNGKGAGNDADKSAISKNGLHIMENRIAAFKGSVTFDSDAEKGFRVELKIPF